MKIDILTLFPEMFGALSESIIGRARDKGLIEINIVDIRNFSKDKHKKCDDAPFGGGAGMVMTPQPLFDAIKSVKQENSLVILTSPRGQTFNQKLCKDLSKYEHLIFVCGHYEGVDERIIELCIDKEISIGDFVLTGGELPALCLIDAVSRKIEGTLGKIESADEDSFSNGLLEYPQYTKPREYRGLKVPEVLLNGNHKDINEYRMQESLKRTKIKRPDLYSAYIEKMSK